mgnify:CR=1 FL=1
MAGMPHFHLLNILNITCNMQQQPTRAFLPFWTYEVQVESRTMPQKERRKERQSRRREKKREIKREGGRKSGGTSKEVKR